MPGERPERTLPLRMEKICMYVRMYIFYIYVCVYVYVYTHRDLGTQSQAVMNNDQQEDVVGLETEFKIHFNNCESFFCYIYRLW